MRQTVLNIATGMLAICVAGTCSFATSAEFEELVKHLPDAANAMVLVDADALFKSPVATSEDWQADREKRFSSGLTSLPPRASKMILSANVDVEVMETRWEAAVVEMESKTLMSSLARRFGGSLEKIYEIPAVRLPDDSFVLQFSDGTFGAISPGNRQQVSQWIGQVDQSPSAYLQKAIQYADTNAQVIMALDLQNVFAAHELDLDKLDAVRNSKVDLAELNKLIASVEGVTLGIAFRDQVHGGLKLDFGQDASLISDIAKPLVLDILGSYGVMIEEFSEWKAEVKGKQVLLGGTLTSNGLTRLASLTRMPTSALQADAIQAADKPAATDAAATEPPTPAAQSTPLETTKKYYDSVTHLIENLRELKGDMKTMGQLAQWCENYGRHVDKLPTLGVDQEMLQYGAYISSQLHGASMGLKGITIQKRVDEVAANNSTKIYGGALGNISQNNWQQSSVGYYGTSVGGNYGRRMETNAAYGIARNLGVSGAINSGLRQQQQAGTAVRTQATASAASGMQQVVQNIVTATTQIRQSMTEKYQVQF
ncbi:MAG: hypothetical protein ABI614_09535 [Planctomycetota bacterium]